MWKFYGISQFLWRKRSFSAKSLPLFPWEMAVYFPQHPGMQPALTWPWGLWRGAFQDPPRSSGATVLPICQQGWEPQNIRHYVVYLNGSSAEGWRWEMVLLNHLACFIKYQVIGREFLLLWVRSVLGTEDPLVPLFGAQSPCMGACCILLPPWCGRDRLCTSPSALDWTYCDTTCDNFILGTVVWPCVILWEQHCVIQLVASCFAFSLQRRALAPAFTVMQEHQQSAPRQDLPFPCPVLGNHTAKVCKPCFSLGTRKIYLVLAKKYVGAVCLKRGLGYQNLTESGYQGRREHE